MAADAACHHAAVAATTVHLSLATVHQHLHVLLHVLLPAVLLSLSSVGSDCEAT